MSLMILIQQVKKFENEIHCAKLKSKEIDFTFRCHTLKMIKIEGRNQKCKTIHRKTKNTIL